MQEQLISFETAKLAKEKGFPLQNKGYSYTAEGNLADPTFSKPMCDAPTQSLLQQWLREKHKLIVGIVPFKDHASDVNDNTTFVYAIYPHGTFQRSFEFKNWEEALEFGLQEALNLIK